MVTFGRMSLLAAVLVVMVTAVLASEESSMPAWAPMLDIAPFDAVHDSNVLLNRSRRTVGEDLGLAVPSGAILALAPRFGWLLYQGEDDEEELDLVFEAEFLYKFPGEEEEEEEEEEEHEHEHGREEERHGRQEVGHHSGFGHHQSPYDKLNREIAGPTDFLLHGHRSKRMVQHRNKRMVRDKKLIYRGLENMFSIMGMDGRSCLLRVICEVTATPLVHDGVVGELLNMALVPRHLNGHHDDLATYVEAEEHGKLANDCGAVYNACPISLFTMVALATAELDS